MQYREHIVVFRHFHLLLLHPSMFRSLPFGIMIRRAIVLSHPNLCLVAVSEPLR